MVAELIDSELGNDTNNTLQGFTFGGAPCSSKMPEKSEQRMPNVSIATACTSFKSSSLRVLLPLTCARFPCPRWTHRNERRDRRRLRPRLLRPFVPLPSPPFPTPLTILPIPDSSSCGMPPPACEVKILDPNTLADLGRNKTGEIYLRGPNVAEGYYKNPKATKEAFGDDGWFQTGDIGHYDSEGYLYISDRAKEIVSCGFFLVGE